MLSAFEQVSRRPGPLVSGLEWEDVFAAGTSGNSFWYVTVASFNVTLTGLLHRALDLV